MKELGNSPLSLCVWLQLLCRLWRRLRAVYIPHPAAPLPRKVPVSISVSVFNTQGRRSRNRTADTPMVNATAATARRDVPATLSFIRSDSKLNRRYIAPMAEINTGLYEDKTVVIRDARPDREKFTLDTGGFVLLDHTSKVPLQSQSLGNICRSLISILLRAISRVSVIMMTFTGPKSGTSSPTSQVPTKSLPSA